VSTRAHANKTVEMSRGGGSPPFDPRFPVREPVRPCKRPRAILKPGGKVCVLILGIACVDFWKSLMHPLLRRSNLCVESLSQSHNRETILSLLSLLESSCLFSRWLLWPCSAGLHVACWPVCTTLSLGERGD
jgi:hypothetical protein